MYQSPVPLIVIRSAAPSLIEVNGQILGECRSDSHIAMPAGDNGDYFISAIPLSFGPWRYILVGKCVILTAESVVLTLCPPAPLEW